MTQTSYKLPHSRDSTLLMLPLVLADRRDHAANICRYTQPIPQSDHPQRSPRQHNWFPREQPTCNWYCAQPVPVLPHVAGARNYRLHGLLDGRRRTLTIRWIDKPQFRQSTPCRTSPTAPFAEQLLRAPFIHFTVRHCSIQRWCLQRPPLAFG